MLYNPKWNALSLADFISWLETKPSNEPYNFFNPCGECAMGQYMAARGVEWNGPNYLRLCHQFFGLNMGYSALAYTKTFGSLLIKMREFNNA